MTNHLGMDHPSIWEAMTRIETIGRLVSGNEPYPLIQQFVSVLSAICITSKVPTPHPWPHGFKFNIFPF